MSFSESLKSMHQNRGLLVGLTVLLTIVNCLLASRPPIQTYNSDEPKSLSYKPDIWPIDGLRPATVTPEETVHYSLDTPSGILEWNSSLPRGRGVIYLRNGTNVPGKVQAYRIALFHQIECLDVIRDQFVKQREDPSLIPAPRTEYCLNYLKHSVLCHADSHLEMVRSEYGGRSVLPYTPRSDCVDWEAVWRATEENHRAHVEEHRAAGIPLD